MDGRTAAATLGVGPRATRDEIRQAFRAKAKFLHPDAGAAGSAERFINLRLATEHLLANAPETIQSPGASSPERSGTPSRFDTSIVGATRPGRAIDLTDSIRRARPHRGPGERQPVTRDARGLSFEDHLAAALSQS